MFKQKILFNKLFSSSKIVGAIKDESPYQIWGKNM